jgi:formiminoglutamase
MYKPADFADWIITEEDITKNSGDFFKNNVLFLDLEQKLLAQTEKMVALIGFECDEGVRRNNGRTGAKEGPASIRKALSKFAWHFKDGFIADGGNIRCRGKLLEKAQKNFGEMVSRLLNSNFLAVGIGGGHEIACAGYLGIRNKIGNSKLGIINFDAHFDLRSTENKLPNSGSSFYQIASDCSQNQWSFNYFCLGIQNFSNSRVLFNNAKNFGVQWQTADTVIWENLPVLKRQLDEFIKKVDHIYLTVCLDVFNAACAPGVSAPNPLGIIPEITVELIKYILTSQKVIYMDIAEMNPLYDIDDRTARLAALLIYHVLEALQN